jgi:hypothetical protein
MKMKNAIKVIKIIMANRGRIGRNQRKRAIKRVTTMHPLIGILNLSDQSRNHRDRKIVKRRTRKTGPSTEIPSNKPKTRPKPNNHILNNQRNANNLTISLLESSKNIRNNSMNSTKLINRPLNTKSNQQ